MFDQRKKHRIAFRPTMDDGRLEERVVLNAAASTAPWMGYLRSGPGGQPSQPSQPTQPPGQTTGAGATDWLATGAEAQARQLNTMYRQQLQYMQRSLQQYASGQIAALYGDSANFGADGRLTPDAISNLQNNLNGAIDAVAYQASSQAALLPGATHSDLLARIQNGLLGSTYGSLTGQVDSTLDSSRYVRTQGMVQNAIDRQISGALRNTSLQIGNYLKSTPLERFSVDAVGQPIPVSQYMANEAFALINNSLGTLANSLGPYAESALFAAQQQAPTTAFSAMDVGPPAPSGMYNPGAAVGFQQQYNNALSTAAFQAGNLLSLFPNSASVRSQLSNAFYNNSANNPSFVNALTSSLPTAANQSSYTPAQFNTAFQNAFTQAYQNATSPLNDYFGFQSATSTVPTGYFLKGTTFPGVFNPSYGANYNNGFNVGYQANGSGFPGFGSAPAGINTNFGTGFNNYINSTGVIGGSSSYPSFGYTAGGGGSGSYPSFGYMAGGL